MADSPLFRTLDETPCGSLREYLELARTFPDAPLYTSVYARVILPYFPVWPGLAADLLLWSLAWCAGLWPFGTGNRCSSNCDWRGGGTNLHFKICARRLQSPSWRASEPPGLRLMTRHNSANWRLHGWPSQLRGMIRMTVRFTMRQWHGAGRSLTPWRRG